MTTTGDELAEVEVRLRDEMVARAQRAARELHDALHALADVAVLKPQQGDVFQWRWYLAEAVSAARRVTNDTRFL